MFAQIKQYIIFLIIVIHSVSKADIIEVDFDQSMGIDHPKVYNMMLRSKKSEAMLSFFRQLYDNNLPSKKKYNEIPIIPKIIHQIWLSNAPLPPLYKHYQKKWQKFHPDWIFKTWTLKDIKSLNLANNDLFEDGRYYAEKTDIARYEILYRFGGLYIDHDVDCFHSLDELHHKYDAYVGLEPPMKSHKMPIINNGIIAFKAGHPILRDTLKLIREKWHYYGALFDNSKNFTRQHRLAVTRSMVPLTYAFYNQPLEKNNTIALPATYFFPINHYSAYKSFYKWYVRLLKKYTVEPIIFNQIRPETLAFHNCSKENRNSEIYNVSFDQSMGKSTTVFEYLNNNNLEDNIYKNFANLYEKIKPINANYRNYDGIPKIIHFVLADEERNRYKKNIDEWIKLHQDWKIMFWNKNQLSQFEITKENFFDDASSIGKKTVLGLSILQQYGGILVSPYLIPIKPFDELVNKYDLFAGLLPPSSKKPGIWVGSSIIAAKPHHYIIGKILKAIRSGWIKSTNESNAKNNLYYNRILKPITISLYRFYQLFGRNIVFPATYFYPVTVEKYHLNIRARIGKMFGLKSQIKFNQVRPESHTSIH